MASLEAGKDINREEWDAFVRQSPQGMFFMRCDYMDIISPGWVAIVERNAGKIIGAMPLQLRKKNFIRYATQPLFSQYWGPMFEPNANSDYKNFSNKRKVLNEMLAALPADIKLISFSCSPEMDYGLPFHLNGFELRTRYTCRLMPEKDEEAYLSSISKSLRQNIRKASEWENFIVEAKNGNELAQLAEKNFAAGRNVMPAVAVPTMKRLAEKFIPDGSCHLLLAQKPGEAPAAGILLMRFRDTITYLFGVADPSETQTDALSILVWKGIRMAAKENLRFEFEGSMADKIESYFRGFNARPVPYLHLYRNRLPLFLKWIKK